MMRLHDTGKQRTMSESVKSDTIWLKARIPGGMLAGELLASTLEESGAAGWIVSPDENDLWTFFRVAHYREQGETRLAHAVRLLQQDGLLPAGPLRSEPVEEADWVARWRMRLGAIRCGKRFVIVPPGVEYAPEAGDRVIAIEPRMAFGTGEHPTTRMALALLEDHAEDANHVLDLGCGNGVLAVGAALAGAKQVTAIDNEPESGIETADNARQHGLEDRIAVVEGDVLHVPLPGLPAKQDMPAFDLILGNILLQPILSGLPYWSTLADTGTRAVFTGVLDGKEAETLRNAAVAEGWELEHSLREGDWYAARFYRPFA
ncbi:methyltransferase domain-containing protein [bacterium]|nr:methyltransferase domain-containing protein [bacterium]